MNEEGIIVIRGRIASIVPRARLWREVPPIGVVIARALSPRHGHFAYNIYYVK